MSTLPHIPAELVLTLSQDMAALPAIEMGADYLLLSSSGSFSVRYFAYCDAEDMFSDGDMPQPRSDFVAWAELPQVRAK